MSFTNQSDLMLENNASKYPAIEVLAKLGYTYISPKEAAKERGTQYNVLLKDVLRRQLQKINQFEFNNVVYKFSADNIERAIAELDVPLTEGLVKTSERIYDALMLGKSFQEKLVDGTSKSFDLNYIDWENFENNEFHVTEEFSCDSWDKRKNARPDIVVFVNGIPFAVIECKAPDISEEKAVEQNIRNQKDEYIPQLFKYVQIVVATNKNAVKYATVGTSKKFWNVWREQETEWQANFVNQIVAGRVPTEQDKTLISLFEKERLRKFAKYFVVYDANVKKICRYQQFFALESIMKTIAENDSAGNRQSGVIWHTQGSGKSLTMVMLAKYILEELKPLNPRVVVVTDRKELDKAIATTFAHTRLTPARATSGKNLCDLINDGKADIITSIINKFNTVDNQGVKNNSRDIFVLVDESHRSNYGSLATKMRTVFPNACYIGFTGTPLLKSEKNTLQTFGKLIHKYTIRDGVEDKAIVPLIYEGRFVDQTVDEQNIDLWFKMVTRKLNKAQIAKLKSRWSSIQKLTSSDSRIKRVAIDIYQHFMDGFKKSGFKAMLACNFKRDAVRYKQIFDSLCDIRTEVVISAPDMREGHDDIDESSDNLVVNFWNKMMKQYGEADEYEDTLKNQFCDGEIDILIVCSKLLTGYNAPRTQVLYIDKELKEHNLLQAIARTNRIHEGKDFGLIVDYRGLIDKLDSAMEVYSGAGLENYDSADIKGVIVDVMSCVARLREAYSHLWDVFTPIKNKKDSEEIEVFLADVDVREKFYNTLCSYGRAFTMVMNSVQAFAAFERQEIEMFRDTLIFFTKIRKSVKIRYADTLDNSEYEPQMRNLLDTYMSVKDVIQTYEPIDIMKIGDFDKVLEKLPSDRSKADAIVSHITKRITLNHDENPAFYDSFSQRINAALEEFKHKVLSEREFLKKMFGVLKDFRKGDTKQKFPEKIAGDLDAQAFYGVIVSVLSGKYKIETEVVADIAFSITSIVRSHDKVDWKNNTDVHNRIRQDIDDLFYEIENNRGVAVEFDDIDKISESVLNVAIRRF